MKRISLLFCFLFLALMPLLSQEIKVNFDGSVERNDIDSKSSGQISLHDYLKSKQAKVDYSKRTNENMSAGVYNNSINVNQVGNENAFVGKQIGSVNTVDVNQVGQGNVIEYDLEGEGNYSNLSQNGNNNYIKEDLQNARNNNISISQQGNTNGVVLQKTDLIDKNIQITQKGGMKVVVKESFIVK
ncbi:MAG: hypothetical protein ACEPOW_12975 [Bacteroidales bacterium]